MTRKDYKMIANIIKHHRDESKTAKGEFAEMVTTFCRCLEHENSNFNREVFERACGLEN